MSADPVIVLFRDTHFLFSTGSREYSYSSDVINWALIPEGDSELPDHATVPAVTVVDDEVYYIPSSRESGSLYKSADPKSGKWEPATKSIATWGPALFCDDDGRTYCYWGCSNSAPMQGVELDKSTLNMFEKRLGMFPAGFDEDGVMYTSTLFVRFPLSAFYLRMNISSSFDFIMPYQTSSSGKFSVRYAART